VVNCAINAWNGPCSACSSYPYDYDLCRAYMDANVCQTELAACANDFYCQQFEDCVSTCGTLAACVACDNTPELFAGRQLLEAYEKCIATECLAESWLP
jgi:hypothetical protein